MGSKPSKISNSIQKVFETSNLKAKWILNWYLEDRFQDQIGTLGEVQKSPIINIFDLWKFGRRIGIHSLTEILPDITPILW